MTMTSANIFAFSTLMSRLTSEVFTQEFRFSIFIGSASTEFVPEGALCVTVTHGEESSSKGRLTAPLPPSLPWPFPTVEAIHSRSMMENNRQNRPRKLIIFIKPWKTVRLQRARELSAIIVYIACTTESYIITYHIPWRLDNNELFVIQFNNEGH